MSIVDRIQEQHDEAMRAAREGVGTAAQAPLYAMPPIRLGQWVFWRPGPRERPGPGSDDIPGSSFPAIVMFAGDRSVNLSILAPDERTFRTRTGVRYINDPSINDHTSDDGVWSYSEDGRDERPPADPEDLRMRVEALERQLGRRGGAAGKPATGA